MAEQVGQSLPSPKGNDFGTVLKLEHKTIRARRDAKGIRVTAPEAPPGKDDDDKAPDDLFGIALSGGGIRSASFCLGALQALDQYGLVHRADYLSTVSGGGYIGASMIAAMTVNEDVQHPDALDDSGQVTTKSPDHKESKQAFPFAAGTESDVRDSEAVSHIRDNSRFLAPRGLYDISISVAILLRGLAVNFVLLLWLLLPLATVIILANPTANELDHSILLDLANFLAPTSWNSYGWWAFTKSIVADPFIISKVAAVVLACWLAGWALRRSYVESFGVWDPMAPLEQGGAGAKIGRALLVWLLVALLLEIQPVLVLWLIDWMANVEASGSWLKAAAAAAASIMAVTATFQATLVVWIQRALNTPTLGARLQALLARAAFYALGLALPLIIYAFFLLLIVWGTKVPCGHHNCYPYGPELLVSPNWTLSLALAGVILVFVVLRQLVVVRLGRDDSPGRWFEALSTLRKRKYSGPVLTTIVVLLIALPLSALATRAGTKGWFERTDEWIVLCNYLVITGLVLVVGANFTENANGLHRLYRDRLRVAFRLGGQDGSGLPLHDIGDKCPYLLVNATLNVRRPKDIAPVAKVERTKGVAVNAGKNATVEAPITGATVQATALGDPAARGAALQATSRLPPPDPAKRGRNAEFFLLSKHFIGSESTGYADSKWIWVQQPELDLAAAAAISGAAVSSSMGRIGIGLLGPTLALLNLRLGFWLPNPGNLSANGKSWEDIFRLYLFAEAFGRLRSDSSRIYITDGGHIDNIGLYQLLKRRCKFIVVVDAEADPGMNFSAFADVQRFARIDEGVLMSLDWWPIRTAALTRLADRSKSVPRDSETHKQHFAVGRIVYEDNQVGILLYVKATVTGDEPDYVLDYERRYPNFPHEATSDQFFSEEQMEAYRALGFHAMQTALDEARSEAAQPAEARAKRTAGLKKPAAGAETAVVEPMGAAPDIEAAERAKLVGELKRRLGAKSISINRRRGAASPL